MLVNRIGKWALAACLLTGGGCSDESGGGSELGVVTPLPGGGVRGELGSALTVVVVSAANGATLPGATVTLASASATTDAQGAARVSVSDSRPISLTVSADGYVPASWHGVLGAELTIPLTPVGYEAPVARVSGTLDGWEALPAPEPGHYWLADFGYTLGPDIDSPATRVTQGSDSITSCRAHAKPEPCEFSLLVPESRHYVFAVIADADERQTPDDTTDDIFTMKALGLTQPLTLTGSRLLIVPRVQLVARDTLVRIAIDATRSPDLSNQVVGVPGINLDGDVMLFPSFGGRMLEFLSPSSTSGLASAKLWTVATYEDAAQRATLRAFVRGAELPQAGAEQVRLASGNFAAAPQVEWGDDGSLRVTGTAGLVTIDAFAQGVLVAQALVTGRALALPIAGIPASADQVRVESYELPVNAADFSLSAVREGPPATSAVTRSR